MTCSVAAQAGPALLQVGHDDGFVLGVGGEAQAGVEVDVRLAQLLEGAFAGLDVLGLAGGGAHLEAAADLGARPIAALARAPGPNALGPPLMPSWRASWIWLMATAL